MGHLELKLRPSRWELCTGSGEYEMGHMRSGLQGLEKLQIANYIQKLLQKGSAAARVKKHC